VDDVTNNFRKFFRLDGEVGKPGSAAGEGDNGLEGLGAGNPARGLVHHGDTERGDLIPATRVESGADTPQSKTWRRNRDPSRTR